MLPYLSHAAPVLSAPALFEFTSLGKTQAGGDKKAMITLRLGYHPMKNLGNQFSTVWSPICRAGRYPRADQQSRPTETRLIGETRDRCGERVSDSRAIKKDERGSPGCWYKAQYSGRERRRSVSIPSHGNGTKNQSSAAVTARVGLFSQGRSGRCRGYGQGELLLAGKGRPKQKTCQRLRRWVKGAGWSGLGTPRSGRWLRSTAVFFWKGKGAMPTRSQWREQRRRLGLRCSSGSVLIGIQEPSG